MKMKEFGLRGGVPGAPLRSANGKFYVKHKPPRVGENWILALPFSKKHQRHSTFSEHKQEIAQYGRKQQIKGARGGGLVYIGIIHEPRVNFLRCI